MAAASANGKVFFAGGDGPNLTTPVDIVDVFDAATLDHNVMCMSMARSYLMGASVGDQVLFAGGTWRPGDYYDAKKRVDIYDARRSEWLPTAELSEARFDGAAATAGSKVLVAGGWCQAGTQDLHMSAVVDIYDSTTGLWSVSSLSVARRGIGGTAFGDLTFFGGGSHFEDWNGASSFTDVVDVYDSRTRTWSVLHLSEARAHPFAITIGNQVLFAGGECMRNGEITVSDTVDIFTIDPVPEPSSLLALAGGMGALVAFRRRRA